MDDHPAGRLSGTEGQHSSGPEVGHLGATAIASRGIPPYEDTDAKEYKALPKIEGTAVEQRRIFTAWVLKQKPTLDPGTKGSYSNAGFTISAAMAERVTGSTWEQLINAEVLEQLGIHAVFTWPVVVEQGQTWGHAETKASVRAVNQASPASALPLFLLPRWNGDDSWGLRKVSSGASESPGRRGE